MKAKGNYLFVIPLIILVITLFNRGTCRANDAKHSVYHPIIREVSQETGLDVNVIMALIKQESNWDPLAESTAGALGLMQVTPESAEEVGIPASALFDPYSNVLAGSRYLLKMYGKFANWGEAFAAYYLGPGRFERNELTGKHWRDLARYLRGIKKHLKNYQNSRAMIEENGRSCGLDTLLFKAGSSPG